MLKILKQKELTQDPLKPCSSQFRSSMRLSCHHELNQIKREGRNLHLSDIYEVWYHDRPSPLAPPALSTLSALSRLPIQLSLFNSLPLSLVASSSLQNPPIQARKGRLRETRKLLKTSTRRYLSQFELIDIKEARATKRSRRGISAEKKHAIEARRRHWGRGGALEAGHRSTHSVASADVCGFGQNLLSTIAAIEGASPAQEDDIESAYCGSYTSNTTSLADDYFTLEPEHGLLYHSSSGRQQDDILGSHLGWSYWKLIPPQASSSHLAILSVDEHSNWPQWANRPPSSSELFPKPIDHSMPTPYEFPDMPCLQP